MYMNLRNTLEIQRDLHFLQIRKSSKTCLRDEDN